MTRRKFFKTVTIIFLILMIGMLDLNGFPVYLVLWSKIADYQHYILAMYPLVLIFGLLSIGRDNKENSKDLKEIKKIAKKVKHESKYMNLNKWNYKTREYEPYNSPAIKPVLYSEDMDLMADCANCGKELKFGDMYTSRTIHNHVGLGFGVCEECYREEFENEKNE